MKTYLKIACGAALALSASFPASAQSAGLRVDGLYNTVDLESRADQSGFHAQTKGYVVAFDAKASETLALKLAYTRADTSLHAVGGASQKGRSDTFFLAGEYRPNDWFLRASASYGFGKTTERSFAASPVRFDARFASGEVLSGVQFENSATLWGFRGAHYGRKKDGKTTADTLTGVIAMTAQKSYQLSENTAFRPAFDWAFTYDFVRDSDAVFVFLPNGAGYAVEAKRLKRLGMEAALGLTLRLADKVDLTARYDGKLKTDLMNHTFTFGLQYDF